MNTKKTSLEKKCRPDVYASNFTHKNNNNHEYNNYNNDDDDDSDNDRVVREKY